MSAEPPAETLRLDVWLWRARFFKTRALATAFTAKRRVRITRVGRPTAAAKPGFALAPGDVVTFARGGVRRVQVVSLGVRRGPAAEAQKLYISLDDVAADPVKERP